MSEAILEDSLRTARSQRKELGKRDTKIGLLGRRIRGLLETMPFDFAETDPGAKLVEALQEAGDYLTSSRRSIRGETAPLEKD